ncbi:MAG: peptide ABC transporter permease [Nitrososphaerota archaeon]
MGVGRVVALRAASLALTLIGVVLITAIIVGPTSDRVLGAIINEQVRAFSQALRSRAAGTQNLTEIQLAVDQYRESLIRAYGLDRPWYMRIFPLALTILTLNLGTSTEVQSFSGSIQVRDIILERIPPTLAVVTTATVIQILVGLYIGTLLAYRRGSFLDRFFSVYAAVSYATPAWWLGLFLIFLFVYRIPIFPVPSGLYSPHPPAAPLLRFLDLMAHAALPITALVFATLGAFIYITRTLVLRIVEEDYVYLAKAKGLPQNSILRSYVMRAAAPPLVTIAALNLAGSLGGAVITETIFNWPGLGLLTLQAIEANSEALILGLTYILASVYVMTRLALEVAYVFLDPRVRY